ncbi:signal transduction histidine kinase [Pseudonocardia sediminis]|uniref:histidine kinase n=2 Tax=Pseudonocardia sediminis TaxID=1397368 RepID=A0A4Q7URZ3_PSEST|nr:signal transduction histidine kinase [Pseudonocardia sediminis]
MPWGFAVPAGLVCALAVLAETGGDPEGVGFVPAAWGLAVFVLAVFLLAAKVPVAGPLLMLAPFLPVGVGAGGAQLIAFMLLLGHTGYRCPPRTALVVAAVTGLVAGGTVAVALGSPWEAGFYPVILGVAAAMGMLLRRERERAEQLRVMTAELAAQRDARAEAAVAQERMRISRELHDAVAHTVSVMTLQAGVVRRRLPDGSAEHTALESVEQLGRRSVDELRRVVGLLREDDTSTTDPAPSLDRLDELAAGVRAAGTPVVVEVRGEPAGLPDGLERSAYRIVQEALSNTVRHAGAASVVVTVEHAPGELRLAVVDDGAGPATRSRGTGYGLLGMRERTELFGGELVTGPEPDGGFAVRARFPVPAAPGLPVADAPSPTPSSAQVRS